MRRARKVAGMFSDMAVIFDAVVEKDNGFRFPGSGFRRGGGRRRRSEMNPSPARPAPTPVAGAAAALAPSLLRVWELACKRRFSRNRKPETRCATGAA